MMGGKLFSSISVLLLCVSLWSVMTCNAIKTTLNEGKIVSQNSSVITNYPNNQIIIKMILSEYCSECNWLRISDAVVAYPTIF